MLRSDLVRAQFGEMLKSLVLPDNWREVIRRQMIAEAQTQGILLDSMEREKERLKLKRTRILKQHREGYIDDDEFHAEIAAVELALHHLQTPEVNGVKFDDVISAGEHLPGMAALWDEATPEERREMVMDRPRRFRNSSCYSAIIARRDAAHKRAQYASSMRGYLPPKILNTLVR